MYARVSQATQEAMAVEDNGRYSLMNTKTFGFSLIFLSNFQLKG